MRDVEKKFEALLEFMQFWKESVFMVFKEVNEVALSNLMVKTKYFKGDDKVVEFCGKLPDHCWRS